MLSSRPFCWQAKQCQKEKSMKLKMLKSAVVVMTTMFFASLCQAQPGIVASQGLNWWGGGASGTPSMSLSSGAQLYVYGATTGGSAPMSAFANGQTVQITNGAGNVSAELAATTSNGNSYTTSTSYDAFGGLGVSGFNYAQGFYGANPGPGPKLQASVTFTLFAPALVVVMGMGSSQATLILSGLGNPTIDVSEVSGVYEPALSIEHEYLGAGTYTVQVTTGDGTQYIQTPSHEVDLIGAYIFSTSPNAASSSNPTIPIPAAFQPSPSTFTPTDMATLNGTYENSITLLTSANLSGSFPYLATESGSGGQNMITVMGLVNNSGQWVGGAPQVVYNGTPSSGGISGTASWSNLTVPSSSGTCQLWFQSYLTTSTSAAISSCCRESWQRL
jgi:hypothetical protein